MPITLQDAKDAVSQADGYFTDRRDQDFSIALSVGRVNVLCGTAGMTVNYGIPYMYELPLDQVNALEQWWVLRHPTSGRLLPPQPNPNVRGGWKINLTWRSNGGTLFNFHIGVPAPMAVPVQMAVQSADALHAQIHADALAQV